MHPAMQQFWFTCDYSTCCDPKGIYSYKLFFFQSKFLTWLTLVLVWWKRNEMLIRAFHRLLKSFIAFNFISNDQLMKIMSSQSYCYKLKHSAVLDRGKFLLLTSWNPYIISDQNTVIFNPVLRQSTQNTPYFRPKRPRFETTPSPPPRMKITRFSTFSSSASFLYLIKLTSRCCHHCLE